MKHIFPILVALVMIAGTAYPQQKKAEKILDEVRDKTESYRSIKIEFRYEMINTGADIHETQDGSLSIKGDKYRLEISGQTVINDGETIWTYIEEANEVQLNTVEEESSDLMNPRKLLSSYTENYKAKYVDERIWMGHNVHVIELKPIEDKTYNYVEIKVDKEKKRLLQITVFDNNDSKFVYTVKEFKPNVLFHNNDFTFNEEDYPDVDVIDMR
jgi:outer membrane lipoprotein-sorting protein